MQNYVHSMTNSDSIASKNACHAADSSNFSTSFYGHTTASSYDLCHKACIICLDHIQVTTIAELISLTRSLTRCMQRVRHRTLSVHVAGCMTPWKLRIRQLAIECAVISIAMGVLVDL